jgi:chorismate dehydratase
LSLSKSERPLRIGCVPYLNAKPLIEWFHDPACDVSAEIIYAVPSELARQLDNNLLDVALVSTFELFQNPGLLVVPDVSISADGPVKSVRLFSSVPYPDICRVALDTSSLTSVALVRILLAERYGLSPEYVSHPPDLEKMLTENDAGLIIGDLRLFDTPATHIMDLGEEWKELTGLPFCYAAWLAREESPQEAIADALLRAKQWGTARIDTLAVKWSEKLGLSLERVQDYFFNVMRYDMDADKWDGLQEFQKRCLTNHLIPELTPLRRISR